MGLLNNHPIFAQTLSLFFLVPIILVPSCHGRVHHHTFVVQLSSLLSILHLTPTRFDAVSQMLRSCDYVQIYSVTSTESFDDASLLLLQVKSSRYSRLCGTKNILTVNGNFPGPTLKANRGDTLIINFHNNAQYNITLHWYLRVCVCVRFFFFNSISLQIGK